MRDYSSTIDDKLTMAFIRMVHFQRCQLWKLARERDLTPIQMQILVFLNFFPDKIKTITDLAHEFSLKKPAISESFQALERKGLVTRERHERDRRSYLLSLTPKGRTMAENIDKYSKIVFDNMMVLSEEEKKLMHTCFVKMITSLYDNSLVNAARICISCEFFQGDKDGKAHHCTHLEKTFSDHEMEMLCPYYQVKDNVYKI